MRFSYYLLKFCQILLFPFSLLYGLIITIRNYLYDKSILKSVSFDLPLICVGNLSAGGTGKSPMVECLLALLKEHFATATLSRGYKRKTKGYLLANDITTTVDIGDEPMQFHLKFPDVAVAVGEKRAAAIPRLLQDRPETKVIILDDAFQHRSIKPGFNILLTEYSDLFTCDFFLPTGNLRDQRSSYKRADIIVVTKCAEEMPEEKKLAITKEIAPLPNQQVFFTSIEYGKLYHIASKEERTLASTDEVLLVCGIANPKPLGDYISQKAKLNYNLFFSDHHTFTLHDVAEIKRRFSEITAEHKIIVTTEKDAVRLTQFKAELVNLPVFVIPVQHHFLFGEGEQFNTFVHTFIENFSMSK